MGEYPHLEQAPIVEALVDIQVDLGPDLGVLGLEAFDDLVKADYPKKSEQRQLGIYLSLGESRQISHADKPRGFKYESSDGLQVVQARHDGFTFSRLKRYETWNNLRAEARRLWDYYEGVAKPASIKRVAVRYTNQMNLQMPLEEYLTAPPIVPPGVEVSVSSFLTRTVVYEPSLDASAIVTQALKGIQEDGVAPVILDIDVFKPIEEGMTSENAWAIIDSFHDFKNQLFFRSITDKVKELYE